MTEKIERRVCRGHENDPVAYVKEHETISAQLEYDRVEFMRRSAELFNERNRHTIQVVESYRNQYHEWKDEFIKLTDDLKLGDRIRITTWHGQKTGAITRTGTFERKLLATAFNYQDEHTFHRHTVGASVCIGIEKLLPEKAF